ncbi:MAG: hypothetical protein R3C45_22275 [Phycisphaerales bacterium]
MRKMLEPDIAVFCLAIWLSELGFSTYYAFYPIYLERIIGIEEHWLG